MSDVSSVGGPGENYKPQYTMNEKTREMWSKFFHGQASEIQLRQANDLFYKNMTDDMNHVLQHALKEQKEREKKEKENG